MGRAIPLFHSSGSRFRTFFPNDLCIAGSSVFIIWVPVFCHSLIHDDIFPGAATCRVSSEAGFSKLEELLRAAVSSVSLFISV